MTVTRLVPVEKPVLPNVVPKAKDDLNKTQDPSSASSVNKDKKDIKQTKDKVSNYIKAGKIFFMISLISIATLFFFGDYIIAAKIVTEKFFFNASIISSILGALCLKKAENIHLKSQESSKIEDNVKSQRTPNTYPGLNNKGCNCFMNSFMQMAMRVKNLRNYLVSDDNKLKEFKEFILQYEKDLKDKKDISIADSQKLREAIHKENPNISKSVSKQEDANEVLATIRRLMDNDNTAFFTYMKATTFYKKDDKEIPLNEIKEKNWGQLELEISKRPFQENFDNFFNEKVDGETYKIIEDEIDYKHKPNHSLLDSLTFGASEKFTKKIEKHYPITKAIREYEKAPDDMFVTLKRFDFDRNKKTAVKNNSPYEVDETIVLIHKNNQKYELDSFVKHIGRSTRSGHYIAYAKIDGKWYEFNDERVSLISDKELKEARDNSYIYHFGRVQ
jgi:ubiquitin C-terminal hydrolase